jgi:uncharacterized protein
MTEVLIFLFSLIAAVLSSMSGGGTAIIMFPMLLSLGLPYPLVLAISKAAATFWVLPAAYNYLKNTKIDWIFILISSALGLVGAYFAIIWVIAIDQRLLQMIVGGIILVLVAYTFFQRELGLTEHKTYPLWRQRLAYVFAPLHGFYENFFVAGNGVAFTMMTFYTKGFDFVKALGHYYAIAFSWCLFGLLLLVSRGYFDLSFMAAGVLGSVIGAYVGSRYARHKGNKFIKIVFLIVGGILGLKLLIGF